MTVRVHLTTGSGAAPQGMPEGRPQGRPFRILVMGDFAGPGRRATAPALAERPIHALDVDRFEAVLARLAPRTAPGPEAGAPALEFRCLDDFHPDPLFARLDLFRDFKELRQGLLDPATFEQAAAALSRGAESGGEEETEAKDKAEDETALFERLLGERPDRPHPAATTGPAARLIAKLVEPYLERSADPERQRLLLAALDDAVATQMRALLRDPGFRRLEALWRGLHWLVGRLETDETLAIGLWDASRDELAADLAGAGGDPQASALARLLADSGAGATDGQPWTLLVGAYAFAAEPPDLDLLGALGAVASGAGAPFLAAADPALLGCRGSAGLADPDTWSLDPQMEAAWRAFRRSPAARWIGLALPRFLLRLPYGARTDPIEAFAFEELPGAAGPEDLLWGNPALACALLLGQAFRARGWNMEPGDLRDLDDLPAHTWLGDEGPTLQPCAEVLIGERAAEALLASGLMPLLSRRDRNAARLLRFQSVADPPAALAGPWR